MRLSVNREAFAGLVAWAAKASISRTTLPVLGQLHLEASGDRLSVAATNLEVRHQGWVEAQVELPGAVLVPAQKLSELARAAVGDWVVLSLNGERLRLELPGAGATYHLATMDPETFPAPPELKAPQTLRWDGEALDEVLDTVGISISGDDKRFNLRCTLLEAAPGEEPKLRFVSTDGHRLTLLDRPNSAGAGLAGARYMIPRDGVLAMRTLLGRKSGEVELRLSKDLAALVKDGRQVMVRLDIESGYPSYQSVIPKATNIKATVRRPELVAAVRRVAIMANQLNALDLELAPDALTVRASGTEIGDGLEKLEATCGQAIKMCLDAHYLLDALEHLRSDEVELGLNDGFNPLVITGQGDPGALFLIMPMRL